MVSFGPMFLCDEHFLLRSRMRLEVNNKDVKTQNEILVGIFELCE